MLCSNVLFYYSQNHLIYGSYCFSPLFALSTLGSCLHSCNQCNELHIWLVVPESTIRESVESTTYRYQCVAIKAYLSGFSTRYIKPILPVCLYQQHLGHIPDNCKHTVLHYATHTSVPPFRFPHSLTFFYWNSVHER